jgi:hypothetical protein
MNQEITRPPLIRRLARLAALSVAWLVGLLALVLGFGAAHYSNLPGPTLRLIATIAFVVLFLGAAIYWRGGWKAWGASMTVFAVVLVWWLLIPARNDRTWITEMAVMPAAEFKGDLLTVHNVRDFVWRTSDDFDIRYEDREYDLSQVRSVDLIVSSWGMADIAHTFFSFGFADGRRLAISVESRREQGEAYSPIPGLFKQYELIYIVGDERDVIGCRAGPRGESLHVYPLLHLDTDRTRSLLVTMLQAADRLNTHPRFYRSIAQNCTTTLLGHIEHVLGRPVPLSMDFLLNGRIDQLLYQRGAIANDAPFEEVRARQQIGPAAKNVLVDSVEYSRAIRATMDDPSRPADPAPGAPADPAPGAATPD